MAHSESPEHSIFHPSKRRQDKEACCPAGNTYNISTRKLRVHGSGHSERPRTDRFVSSSVGSLAFVPGKDGWLLLMIFSLTKNIIHRTQISESAGRRRRWIEPPHRRENLDQSRAGIPFFRGISNFGISLHCIISFRSLANNKL